jgi:3-oxoacyl-[acyl-carrier-protein] reductase
MEELLYKCDMMRLLENKVCIITGTAQGIGKAIAERFAEDGAIVYACDRIDCGMDAWAKACTIKFQTRVQPVCLDVTDSVAVKDVFMTIYRTEGKIDVLVNNAGVVINRKIGMILRQETELMFKVNVIAVLELIQLVARLMGRNRSGAIINIASITAVAGSSGQVAYSASKGAVISLTKSASKELASLGIRVNAVAPGIIKTERFVELYEANGEQIDTRIRKIALGRLGTPEDVADACSFLASDRASYISGQILGVDGCASV